MLNDGVPIALVASRLAHVRASTTLNVYAHATPGGDREAAEVLALRLMGRSAGESNASNNADRTQRSAPTA
jgi:hypothetical protein